MAWLSGPIILYLTLSVVPGVYLSYSIGSWRIVLSHKKKLTKNQSHGALVVLVKYDQAQKHLQYKLL